MKKYIVPLSVLCLLFSACGSNGSNATGNKTDDHISHASATNDLNKDPDYQKGLALVAKNDCLTCHKISGESTGPSYEDVANKYESNETNTNMLAEKIRNGGSGHWGSVPMASHPGLSVDDAKQMVKYILMLGTKK